MIAIAIADLFHARRVGPGKWVAYLAHGDCVLSPSLR
jgi:hypothetical protein